MDLKLIRNEYEVDGIFGYLQDTSGKEIAVTLEHSYVADNDGFAPKVPKGEYKCVRGMHRLESMTEPFETFEITNVPGHTNILIHFGNFNCDSAGCILIGESLAINPADKQQMITASRVTFGKFMRLQNGIDSFTLTII